MKRYLASPLFVLFILAPSAAWPMAEFEYYKQTPEAAWDKTRRSVLKAAGRVMGYSEPGRGAGAEDTPKCFVTTCFSITLPPGWSARPRDLQYKDVVFTPRDKRVDIIMEASCLDTELNLRDYTSRYVKWLEAEENSRKFELISFENTLQASLPCSIIASSFESGGARLIQVVKLLTNGRRIYMVKCVSGTSAWASNFEEFMDCIESFRPKMPSERPGVACGIIR